MLFVGHYITWAIATWLLVPQCVWVNFAVIYSGHLANK